MTDEQLMRAAVREAEKTETLGRTPIGYMIAREGKIITRSYNRRITDRQTLAHAELFAFRRACRKKGDWRLEDCTLYVTLEPCPICAGIIVRARIPWVAYGASNPKADCTGSVLNLLDEPRFNHQVSVEAGMLGDTCATLMRGLFRELRAKRKAEQSKKREL